MSLKEKLLKAAATVAPKAPVPDLASRLKASAPPSGETHYHWNTNRKGPRQSHDLDRVVALPRRPLVLSHEAADAWTARLKRRDGTMKLRPIQAAALEEAEISGGLFGLIGVGFGKTLISLLLPTVWESSVAVLLVPPNLRTKLFEHEYPELSRHWRLPNLYGHPIQYPDTKGILHVVSYSELSSPKRAGILEDLKPDAIVCDEGHSLRHATAARTKRFKRYFKKSQPRTVVGDDGPGSGGVFRCHLAVLSGTLTARSITDYAHLSGLALGSNSPLPLDWPTLQEWSATLDASEYPAPDGELRRLCRSGESVRDGFRRRLVETPGVVATETNDPGMPLVLSRRELEAPASVKAALQNLRDTWTRPDGEELVEAIEFYAVARQLASGFFYRRVYPRKEPKEVIREWNDARKSYFQEVRERLKQSIPGQDSPLLLWNAAASGKWHSPSWEWWKGVKDSVEPATETVWLDKFLVHAAVEWAKEAPGLVWVEAEAVKAALAIAKEANIPVYTGGRDDERALIAEDGKRSVVVGIKAFNAGINLQHAFKRNLITTCPSSATLLEQVAGRTHRERDPLLCTGLVAFDDDVTVDFYLHTAELADSLKTARSTARYIEDTTGSRQKLSVATYTF